MTKYITRHQREVFWEANQATPLSKDNDRIYFKISTNDVQQIESMRQH